MKTETRPGLQTTELWLVIVANLLVNVGAIDVGGGKYRGILAIVSVVGYALSRGLAKAGVANTNPVALLTGDIPGRTEGVKASGFEAPTETD